MYKNCFVKDIYSSQNYFYTYNLWYFTNTEISKKSFHKAESIFRSEILDNTVKNKNKTTPRVLTYHASLKQLRGHSCALENSGKDFKTIKDFFQPSHDSF